MVLKTIGFLASCFVVLSLTCVFSPKSEEIVSTNAKTSACRGFSLSKKAIRGLIAEDTMRCLEETLFWRYDSATQILTLVYRRFPANCSAVLQMDVTRSGSGYAVHTRDVSNPNGRAMCDCTFDMYCEIPNVNAKTVELSVDTLRFSVDLTAPSGKQVIHPLKYLMLAEEPLSDLSILWEYPQLIGLSDVDMKKYPDLSPIKALTHLKSLSCDNVDSLGFLNGLSSLETIQIAGTDKLVDLTPLGNCTVCTSLELFGCSGVNDLGPLKTLTNLKSLNVSGSPAITGIGSLAALTKLETISFSPAENITSLQPLSGLTELIYVRLTGLSKVSSIEPMKSLLKIAQLEISGNGLITDISALSGMTSLQSLVLSNMTAVQDFNPLLSCLRKDDIFIFQGTAVPQNVLDLLRRQGVAYKN